MNALIQASRMVYYGEVKANNYANLMEVFKDGVLERNKNKFVACTINDRDKVKDAILKFLDIKKHTTNISESSEA